MRPARIRPRRSWLRALALGLTACVVPGLTDGLALGVTGSVVLGLTACGDAGAPAVPDAEELGTVVTPQGPSVPRRGGPAGPQADLPTLVQLLAGPEQVEFRGERRVHLAYGPQPIVFREDVASDGEGHFHVEALEVLSGHPDPDLFLLWENNHPGYTFRYRDFRVWDLERFHENYLVSVLPQPVTVADVSCSRLRVRRRGAPADHYFQVDVDPQSGLVLAWQEHDAGQVLADVAFTSLDLQPDLSSLALDDHRLDRQPVDLAADLGPQVHFDVLRPQLPPAGYELVSGALMYEVPGDVSTRWLRLEYTDGADRTVLLQRPPDPSQMIQGSSTGTIRVLQVGSWTVLHGQLRGQRVIAAGRAPESELLQMLQSAL